MKPAARGNLQEVRSKMQEVRSRKQAVSRKRQSLTVVRSPSLDKDANDETWVAQMMEWLTTLRADSSSDMIRRVIERVERLM
jgi:ribosomal protein S10